MKIAVVSKEVYKFGTMAVKLQQDLYVCIFVKFNKPILKPIWGNSCVGIVKKYLKTKYNDGGLAPSDNKTSPS